MAERIIGRQHRSAKRRRARNATALTQSGKMMDALVDAIALTECAMHSLCHREIGYTEQVALKLVLVDLWRVHDALDEPLVVDDADTESP